MSFTVFTTNSLDFSNAAWTRCALKLLLFAIGQLAQSGGNSRGWHAECATAPSWRAALFGGGHYRYTTSAGVDVGLFVAAHVASVKIMRDSIVGGA